MRFYLFCLFILFVGVSCGDGRVSPTPGRDTPTPSPRPLTPTLTPTLPPTPTPLPPPTATPLPTATPAPSPTPAFVQPLLLGDEVMGYRLGHGAFKVVVVSGLTGNDPAGTAWATYLLDHYRQQPQQLPAGLSLIIIPALSPTDLSHEADTAFDNCPDGNWDGDSYPFADPTAAALRDFVADAWLVLFYQSGPAGIIGPTCPHYEPANQLLTWFDLPLLAPAGTGRWVDYLAGEDIAAATIQLGDQPPENQLASLQNVLGQAESLFGPVTWLDERNTGRWQFPANLLVHPLALERLGDTLYVLDTGRVLALNLQTAALRQLLAPGDTVDGVRVLEPLDLASDGQSLLALDRAGDVYRFDPAGQQWTLDRYDRPVADTSSDYYVALGADPAGRYLLETSYKLVIAYRPDNGERIWLTPDGYDIDLSSNGQSLYLLNRATDSQAAGLFRYQDAQLSEGFAPTLSFNRPRQVVAGGSWVGVLDQAGYRLAVLDGQSGQTQTIYRLRQRQPFTAIWSDGQQWLAAGRDTLYFLGQPSQQAKLNYSLSLPAPLPNDPLTLNQLRGLALPITGSRLPERELQMPGAPRHYRLGIHEGVDFYWAAGTPVQAIAPGRVIRAGWDYVAPTPLDYDFWFGQALALGYTSEAGLDFFRGRQVWLEHDNGLVSRYIHLSALEYETGLGMVVPAGAVIAYSGNTGSPGYLQGPNEDAHLHFELWLGDYYVGQFLRPIETRDWLTIILN